MKRLNKQGFTIIELLIATVTFSVVLLVVTGAIVQIGRIYYKGVVQARVQERTRAIVEDISQTIEFSHASLGGNQSTNPGYICAGSKVYTFSKGVRLDSSHRVLVMENGGSCPGSVTANLVNPPLAALSGRTELAGDGMQLLYISVNNVPAGSDLYQIKVRMAYGSSSDMIDDVNLAGAPIPDGIMDRCKTIRLGGQFCAISELSTNVSSRFK